MTVTLCNKTHSERKLDNPDRPGARDFKAAGSERRRVADRIGDFLDGRNHGEDLFHELYDYVLAEPIPPQMRALLRSN
jgi:hypothetical protein